VREAVSMDIEFGVEFRVGRASLPQYVGKPPAYLSEKSPAIHVTEIVEVLRAVDPFLRFALDELEVDECLTKNPHENILNWAFSKIQNSSAELYRTDEMCVRDIAQELVIPRTLDTAWPIACFEVLGEPNCLRECPSVLLLTR
jgi:hypothetical protein